MLVNPYIIKTCKNLKILAIFLFTNSKKVSIIQAMLNSHAQSESNKQKAGRSVYGLAGAGNTPRKHGCLRNAVCSGFLVLALCGIARGNIDPNRLADAIYKAEGGVRTTHPYGILAHYKKTTPRQACINTIRHAQKDWNGKGDFIEFLGGRYCPIGVKNDPKGLNKNWIKNVKFFYEL